MGNRTTGPTRPDTGAGSEAKRGIQAGFDGRAAGGKTINSAVKGKTPKPNRNTIDDIYDKWTPSLTPEGRRPRKG